MQDARAGSLERQLQLRIHRQDLLAEVAQDAPQRFLGVGVEAQHQHRRGVGGAHRPQPSFQSTRRPSMVDSLAPSNLACSWNRATNA